MKKIIIISTITLVLLSVFYYLRHPLGVKVQIGDHVFSVDVAVTTPEKELGLGNRDSLEPNRGMLFVYDHKERFSYWMKNMRFPIDILWIADDTIVDMTKNIPVDTVLPLKIYSPNVPVNRVLELNAGICDQYSIRVGDTVHVRM
jgi:uncharacterized membrane protein (UPF0127 family)